MEQVEEVCENIILINNGKKLLEGNVAQIKDDHKENLFKVEFDNSALNVKGLVNFQVLESLNDSITVKLDEGMRPNDLLGSLIGKGAEIESFNEILPSINDIFISRVEGSKE
jgi:ABC-2 type transport system ATP-binding protein